MSDRETIKAMLDRAGIKYHEGASVRGYGDEIAADEIHVVAREGEHNHGYPLFHTSLKFGADGQLVSWGCWE